MISFGGNQVDKQRKKQQVSLPAAFACVCVLSFENSKDVVEELDQPKEPGCT